MGPWWEPIDAQFRSRGLNKAGTVMWRDRQVIGQARGHLPGGSPRVGFNHSDGTFGTADSVGQLCLC
jgi:hypothetical protein